ncbi:hypothetical protein TURU_100969 [Turdus rufiventris]|nr:hypothetical protein TURU_100969 [Turdus rufiventris]
MEGKLGLAVREDEEVMSPWLLPIPPVSDSPGDRVATLSSLLQVWLAVALWLQLPCSFKIIIEFAFQMDFQSLKCDCGKSEGLQEQYGSGFRLEKEKQQRVEFEATLGCTHPALVHCHKQMWATGQGGFAAANKPNLGNVLLIREEAAQKGLPDVGIAGKMQLPPKSPGREEEGGEVRDENSRDSEQPGLVEVVPVHDWDIEISCQLGIQRGAALVDISYGEPMRRIAKGIHELNNLFVANKAGRILENSYLNALRKLTRAELEFQSSSSEPSVLLFPELLCPDGLELAEELGSVNGPTPSMVVVLPPVLCVAKAILCMNCAFLRLTTGSKLRPTLLDRGWLEEEMSSCKSTLASCSSGLLAHMAYALLLVMMLNQSFLQFCICPQLLESFQQFSIYS